MKIKDKHGQMVNLTQFSRVTVPGVGIMVATVTDLRQQRRGLVGIQIDPASVANPRYVPASPYFGCKRMTEYFLPEQLVMVWQA